LAENKKVLRRSHFRGFLDFISDFAYYGKTRPTNHSLLTVPKHWFVSFYIIGAIYNTWLIWNQPVVTALTSYLYHIHIVRRLLESFFVTVWSPAARMHIAHFVLGVTYYIAAPLTYRVSSETNRQTYFGERSSVWLAAQVCAYILLQWIQFRCHSDLANLRPATTSTHVMGKTKYAIPRGLFFTSISCPHFLAEIAIYFSLAVLSNFSPSVVALNLFVAIELSLSAKVQHRWYRKSFENYPQERRALVPWFF